MNNPSNKFEEVSTDIILALSNIHYEDKEKELIKLEIQYVLCKMTQTRKEFDDDLKVLDDDVRRRNNL